MQKESQGTMALDMIGTPQAFQVTATDAQSETNGQGRGLAFRSLVEDYDYRVKALWLVWI